MLGGNWRSCEKLFDYISMETRDTRETEVLLARGPGLPVTFDSVPNNYQA